MPGRAGAILAAAALSAGAAVAAADGSGAWDHRAGSAPPRALSSAAPRERGRVCELEGADRATTPSLRCIACHGGDGPGPMIDFQMAPDGHGMSHPVEVDYAEAAARQPDRYHLAPALPREVPLVNGKVACTSCHDGASPDPKHVAIPARLCESCHRL